MGDIFIVALIATIWVRSGLFVSCLMQAVDEVKGEKRGCYWIKDKGVTAFTILLALCGFISLFLIIFIVIDYVTE